MTALARGSASGNGWYRRARRGTSRTPRVPCGSTGRCRRQRGRARDRVNYRACWRSRAQRRALAKSNDLPSAGRCTQATT